MQHDILRRLRNIERKGIPPNAFELWIAEWYTYRHERCTADEFSGYFYKLLYFKYEII